MVSSIKQSLVVAGLFPDHAKHSGVSLIYIVDKGLSAYEKLTCTFPSDFIYAYMYKNFIKVVDMLRGIAAFCGEKRSIDLIEACELWQETGSRHSLAVIRNKTGSFPSMVDSQFQH